MGAGSFKVVFAMSVLFLASSCGYSLQNTRNSELERLGIKKIYVAPLVNNTYKSGVENLVYNALVKGLSSYKNVSITQSPLDADAMITGTVNSATFSGVPTKTADALAIPGVSVPDRFRSVRVAGEYSATLNCTFILHQFKRDAAGVQAPPVALWGATFNRARPFPATHELSSLGTTTALINDSEFDRTLLEMAQSMMADVRESMLARF